MYTYQPRGTLPQVMRAIALTSGFSTPDLPANWKILVGIAALVAEEILCGDTDDAGAIADAEHLKISNDEASATDLASMGITDIEDCDLSYEVVEEAARILREGWLVVQQEAESLIEFATG